MKVSLVGLLTLFTPPFYQVCCLFTHLGAEIKVESVAWDATAGTQIEFITDPSELVDVCLLTLPCRLFAENVQN